MPVPKNSIAASFQLSVMILPNAAYVLDRGNFKIMIPLYCYTIAAFVAATILLLVVFDPPLFQSSLLHRLTD